MKGTLIFFSSLVLCSQLFATDVTGTKAIIEQNLQASIRNDDEKARDANRKPAEVLEFFGLRDELKVLEISPATGYWTKFLAPTLRANGELVVSIGVAGNFDNNVLSLDGLDRVRAINDGIGLGDIPEFSFDEGNFDLVLTFWNLHNPDAASRANLNKAVFGALKSGGIYGVVDHTRRHGQATNRAVGRRLDPVLVVKEMLDIGFELADFSDMHYHPEDDLTKEVGSAGVRGNTDRFTLKFRKP